MFCGVLRGSVAAVDRVGQRAGVVSNAPLESKGSNRAVPLVVGAYAIVAAVGLGIAALRGEPNVFVCESYRLGGSPLSGHLTSLAGGVAIAITIIAGTRYLVRTTAWASALHEDLRPMARALGEGAIVPIALASSVGEEVLFRGALVPWVGVIVSSILFGALHQMRGRSRLSWIAFAIVVGMLFGGLFRATGSLLGPIVAHALINGANLRFLITHAPARRETLGGLLRR
jgi:membrane protease YdiL (CAAX protease family)